jgi:hypothetical protein
MIGNKSKLEKWMGVISVLRTKSNGFVTGKIQYGVRIPCASGMIPLKKVDHHLRHKKERGEDYWFVSDNETVKVRLLTARASDTEVRGYGLDVEIFKYKITTLGN